MTMKTRRPKTYGKKQKQCLEGNLQREFIYYKRIRNRSQYLTFHLRIIEEEEQIKPKVSGRKEIVRTRSEIR